MLNLPPPSEDELVVRDGPKKKLITHVQKKYQSKEERIKTFLGWPLIRIIHSNELAHVGFIYTGEGALVQCFQCGFMHSDWRKGDVPLDIHQFGNPDCPFLQTLTSGSNSSPPEEQATSLSSTQSQSTDGSTGQFPSRSNQVTRTGEKWFMEPSGSPDLPRHRAQDWEGSDDDGCPNHRSLMTSAKLCIAQAERGNTHHRNGPDNSFKCFKSPKASLSGSSRTSRCSSEELAVSNGLMTTQ